MKRQEKNIRPLIRIPDRNSVDPQNRRESFKKETLGPTPDPVKRKVQGWVQECFVFLFSLPFIELFFLKNAPHKISGKGRQKKIRSEDCAFPTTRGENQQPGDFANGKK